MLKIKEFLATRPISWRHLATSLGILLTGPLVFHLGLILAQHFGIRFNGYIVGLAFWGFCLTFLATITVTTVDSDTEHAFISSSMGAAMGIIVLCFVILLNTHMAPTETEGLHKLCTCMVWALCLGLSIDFYRHYPFERR